MNLGPRIRTLYNPRGLIRPVAHSTFLHAARFFFVPEYRFLQKLHRLERANGRHCAGALDFEGRPIRYVDLASFASAWDEIFVNGIYDIGDVATEDCYFVDAGSNIGLGILYWTRRYPRAHGVALEPDPIICQVLRANLAEWNAQFEVQETAVGTAEGVVRFERDGADAGHISPRASGREAIEVKVRRLSPLLDRPVTLLKIDIEGAEYDVLEEIRSSLANVRRIFVECHADLVQPQRFGSLIHLLQEAGFRCQVHSSLQYPHPFRVAGDKAALDVSLNVFGAKP